MNKPHSFAAEWTSHDTTPETPEDVGNLPTLRVMRIGSRVSERAEEREEREERDERDERVEEPAPRTLRYGSGRNAPPAPPHHGTNDGNSTT
jgi:hypothetical protein